MSLSKQKCLVLPALILWLSARGQWVSNNPSASAFPIHHSSIYVDPSEQVLIQKSAQWLQNDIEKVTGYKPPVIHHLNKQHRHLIIIGSFSHCRLLKQLIAAGRIRQLHPGKWEAYQIRNIQLHYKGIDQALVIGGEDRRGTAYGTFELSKAIGVSPWYWWADVPVKKSKHLFIRAGLNIADAPKVKYRGIFLNDEAPALTGWAKEKFGGLNHAFYEEVFELLLRLKGNYLWPAMWGNAFNDDDPDNRILADQYGIVMGTSHHEPMLRSQQEWKRYGKGEWNYQHNESILRDFWRQGIKNMGTAESIVTIGMRGDGDMPMSETSNIQLLEKIVADQRQIITGVTGKAASQTPQLWALYKEVQDYYDKGMRVPDDVTVLLCDDNWGNVRRLPGLTEPKRAGGYGLYYHFDYVGGPRNYKWLNTNPLPRIWEQLHLAYAYNVKQIWIANVGDLKPMEVPVSFFLDYAWNPEAIGTDEVKPYLVNWCSQQFGKAYAPAIARFISLYAKYNARRKPELLDENTYSLSNYNEWARVFNEYQDLLKAALKLKQNIPLNAQAAYFELVLHPIMACANLYKLYYYTALNHKAYAEHDFLANAYADSVKTAYRHDSIITRQYHELKGGKWNHMMSQTHIGYINWQQPALQQMPQVKYLDGADTQKATTMQKSGITPRKANPEKLFAGKGSFISIDADHFTSAHGSNNISWKVLPDLGRTGNAVTSWPVTTASLPLSAASPYLCYNIRIKQPGDARLNTYFSPTLNFLHKPAGLQFALSVDDDKPQIISLNNKDDTGIWNKWVAENIIIKTAVIHINKPGVHTLKYWLIDPGIVLQKIVLDLGGLKPSYLGPPETD